MSEAEVPAARSALDEQYEIIRELGRGGTALVYLARERATGVEVAIKIIRAKYIEDEEAQARFAREARFVAELEHPNIVPLRAVLDLGNGGIALVMTHVDGRTLKQYIKEQGRLSPQEAEKIMRDVAHALGAAHDRGIVHRDVKPENIFIDSHGRALLADFGLARSMKGDTQLTMAGIAIGTPSYMAPEQIDGGELDARGDIYSLGLVAWEMLTGRRPWDAESLYAVLYHQKYDKLPDVREVRDDVPDVLANVIAVAIEKDRDARWQHMHELLAALNGDSSRVSTPRTPVSAETVRFARPVSPGWTNSVAVATVAPPSNPPVSEADRIAAMAALADEYARLSADDERPLRRPFALLGGAAVAILAIVVIAVITTAVQGRSSAAANLRINDQPAAVQLSGDLGRPAGVRVDSAAQQIADTGAAIKDTVVATATPRDTAVSPQSQVAPVKTAAPPRSTAPAPTPVNPQPVAAPVLVAPPPTVAVSRPPAVPRVNIVAGGMHSCLVSAEGRIFCWGANDHGQLGNGASARAATPVAIGSDTRFTALSIGLAHSCAIARGGTVWCWGNNDHGQLGDRSVVERSTPVRAAEGHLFRSIAAGASHTCGLDIEGAAWCWGSDAQGQLGDNGTRDSGAPVAVAGGKQYVSLDLGWNFACALDTKARANCWGDNHYGQIGDGGGADRHAPVPVAGDIPFTSVATGNAHACAVTAVGDAYCWGRNNSGQLGDGTKSDRSSPVHVKAIVRFVSVAAGAVHSCGLTAEGDAYCWGSNTYGQLGDGTTLDQPQPVRVSGGHNFASLRAFASHTCGVTASGEAFCWGYNLDGQLGDGTRTHRTRPVYVESPGPG